MKNYPDYFQKIVCDVRYENNQNQLVFHLPKVSQSIALSFCNDLTLQFPISNTSIPNTVKLIDILLVLNSALFGKLKHNFDPQSNLNIVINVSFFMNCSKQLLTRLDALQIFLSEIMNKLSQGDTNITSLANSIVSLLNPIIAFSNSLDIISQHIIDLVEIEPLSPDFVKIASAISEIIEALNSIYSNSTDGMYVETQQEKLSTHYSYVIDSLNQYIPYLKQITQQLLDQFQDITIKDVFQPMFKFYQKQIDEITEMIFICIDIVRNDYENYDRTIATMTKTVEKILHELPFIFQVFYEKKLPKQVKTHFEDYQYVYSDLISPFISQIIESSEKTPADFNALFISKLKDSLKVYNGLILTFPSLFEGLDDGFPQLAVLNIQPSEFLKDSKIDIILPVLQPALTAAHALIETDQSFSEVYKILESLFQQQPSFQEEIENIIPDQTDDGIILLMGARDAVLNSFTAIVSSVRDYSVSQTDLAMRSRLASNVCRLIASLISISTHPSMFEYIIETLLLCSKWMREYLSSNQEEYMKAASASRSLIFDSNDAVQVLPKLAQLLNMVQLATNETATKLKDDVEAIPTVICHGAVLSSMMDAYDFTVQKATSDDLVKPLIEKAIEQAFPLHNFVSVSRTLVWLLLHSETSTLSTLLSNVESLHVKSLGKVMNVNKDIIKALDIYKTSRSTSNLDYSKLLSSLKKYLEVSNEFINDLNGASKSLGEFFLKDKEKILFTVELVEGSTKIIPIPNKNVTGILLHGLSKLARAQIKEMNTMLDQLPDRALLQSISLTFYLNTIYEILVYSNEPKFAQKAEDIEKSRVEIVRVSSDAACGDYSNVQQIKDDLQELDRKLIFEDEIDSDIKACLSIRYMSAIGIDHIQTTELFKKEQKNLELTITHEEMNEEQEDEDPEINNEQDTDEYGQRDPINIDTIQVFGDSLVFPAFKLIPVAFNPQSSDESKSNYKSYIDEEPIHEANYNLVDFKQPEPTIHFTAPPWPPVEETTEEQVEEKEIEVEVEIYPFEEEEDHKYEMDSDYIEKFIHKRMRRDDSSFDSLDYSSSMATTDLSKKNLTSSFSMPEIDDDENMPSSLIVPTQVELTPIGASDENKSSIPKIPTVTVSREQFIQSEPIKEEPKHQLPQMPPIQIEQEPIKVEEKQKPSVPTFPTMPPIQEPVKEQPKPQMPQMPPIQPEKAKEERKPSVPSFPTMPPMPVIPQPEPVKEQPKPQMPVMPPLQPEPKPSMPPMNMTQEKSQTMPVMPPLQPEKAKEERKPSMPSMPQMPQLPPMTPPTVNQSRAQTMPSPQQKQPEMPNLAEALALSNTLALSDKKAPQMPKKKKEDDDEIDENKMKNLSPQQKQKIEQIKNVKFQADVADNILMAFNPSNPHAVLKMLNEALGKLDEETRKLEGLY
ncbi:hypothetical protein TVAG_372110 [Trichomonas vaginalis G3]|uniref:Uncharacterized protein n=1 Tax=Trichomonas vaginalis (strain ATCC PRA-98 / G3) TaxID=412133 RepID=A2E0Y2_TRIV3|nr:hypothetical protein TVAGG3_0326440 [Trichomonas vaginalis G3]EAY13737.1 hypothetical protein TVAG_372110 [Trichomonas vaginalis G3]KAI5529669.1 hypothetical protein TVAGG3_0326440 [Trichomonas vaginalis G3]|eukprot:XP_001325960.1 hypothetical protein [Trichomonas vaginalis G3]